MDTRDCRIHHMTHQPFPPVPDLQRCLRGLIAQIPAGRVATCGGLAEALGNPLAATWVGQFALHHAHDAECHCHRIVRVGGKLGGYVAGAVSDKIRRLVDEGVEVREERIDLDQCNFNAFQSDRPLEELRRVQEMIQTQIAIRARRRTPKWVGGVDVAYPTSEEGVAAYALIEVETAALVWSTTVRRRVTFPYITTYLSFREIPVLLDLLEQVRAAGRLAEVLMVDGSGILHHRHAGIASHLGVVASTPTIGVTKKLLCGQVDLDGMSPGESRPVVYEHRPIGAALRATAGSARPIFISPGHRVDLAFSERLVRRLLTGRRLPEPLYWADRLSRTLGR